jgi:hypothetical protein
MRHAVIGSKALGSLAGLVLAAAVAAPSPAAAQSGNTEALGLVRDAMDAYSNLDLDLSKAKLDKALTLATKLDKTTLARVYVSLGVLHIGGFADNAKGQQSFMIALCLDNSIMVDPMLSAPEIDMLFTMARNQVNPGQCQHTLSTIVMPAAAPVPGPGPGPGPGPVVPPVAAGLAPCGQHTPPVEQRQKYELPVYLELATQNYGRVNRLVFKYAFDGAQSYNELDMKPAGRGFGVQIDCDSGQIRIFDPSSITYYIEGYDRMGNLICGHGTAGAPLVVAMTPAANPLPALPGLNPPKECAPCAPWDTTCQQGGLPGLDEPCDPTTGCAEGLVCGDAGLCAGGDGVASAGGPKTFYVNLGAGSGAGFMSVDMEFDKITSEGGTSVIEHVEDSPSGFAWSGIPLRLAFGYYLIEHLALELTGRFDVKIDSFSQPVSCADAAADAGLDWDEVNCFGGTPADEEAATKAVALKDNGEAVKKKQNMVAWLANLRVKYDFIDDGGLRIAAFAGVGYGRVKYRIAAGDSAYFPMPGFIDIEVGAQLMYYFTPNFGLGLEVPIDILVADGFGLNFEGILALSFGF